MLTTIAINSDNCDNANDTGWRLMTIDVEKDEDCLYDSWVAAT